MDLEYLLEILYELSWECEITNDLKAVKLTQEQQMAINCLIAMIEEDYKI